MDSVEAKDLISKIDQEEFAMLNVNFISPKPEQESGELPIYMYWYETPGVLDRKLLDENSYEFIDTLGPGFPTIRNGEMIEEKVEVKNARLLPKSKKPTICKDGFDIDKINMESDEQRRIFNDFDMESASFDALEELTRYVLLPSVLSSTHDKIKSSAISNGQDLKIIDAMVFDYTYRFSKEKEGFKSGKPALQAHVDFTASSAEDRIRSTINDPDKHILYRKNYQPDASESRAYLKPKRDERIDEQLTRQYSDTSLSIDASLAKHYDLSTYRIIMINAWLPLTTVHAKPLIVCASSTIDAEKDLFSQKMYFSDRDGEVCVVRFEESQSWFYFPHMSFGEILFLRTWDSDCHPSAFWTPHSAALDPREEQLDLERQSVEIRMAFVVER